MNKEEINKDNYIRFLELKLEAANSEYDELFDKYNLLANKENERDDLGKQLFCSEESDYIKKLPDSITVENFLKCDYESGFFYGNYVRCRSLVELLKEYLQEWQIKNDAFIGIEYNHINESEIVLMNSVRFKDDKKAFPFPLLCGFNKDGVRHSNIMKVKLIK